MLNLDDTVAATQFARTIASIMLLALLCLRLKDVMQDEFIQRASVPALFGIIVYVFGATISSMFWTFKHMAAAVDAHGVASMIYDFRLIGVIGSVIMITGVAIVFASAAKYHVTHFGAGLVSLFAVGTVAVGAWLAW